MESKIVFFVAQFNVDTSGMQMVQGGPLLVINGVITAINGLING